MNSFYSALLTATTGTQPGNPILVLVIELVVIVVAMYFIVFRPQKKQQKQQDELMKSLAIGDSVLTTGGFYGTVIGMVDENVIVVEFGNNKNCRIPMKRTAVVEVEKNGADAKPAEAPKAPEENQEKKGFFSKFSKVKE